MCVLTISLITGIATATSIGASLGIASTTGAVLATAGLVTAEVVGIGASIAGGVASTVAGVQQAQQNAALAEYQASVAEENAKMAERSAVANDLQANQKRLALLQQMQQTQGNMRADFAARGVVLGSGTPQDYEADLADAYDLDKRNLEYDVATKSWQYRVQAHEQNEQAELYRAQAKAYRSGIPGTIAGGLLSTAGNLGTSLMGSFSLSKELNAGKAATTGLTWGQNATGKFGMVG